VFVGRGRDCGGRDDHTRQLSGGGQSVYLGSPRIPRDCQKEATRNGRFSVPPVPWVFSLFSVLPDRPCPTRPCPAHPFPVRTFSAPGQAGFLPGSGGFPHRVRRVFTPGQAGFPQGLVGFRTGSGGFLPRAGPVSAPAPG
jgi:hypothetical protein